MAKNYPKEVAIEKALVTHADLDGDDGNLVTNLLSGKKKMLEQIVLYENMFSTYMSGAIFLTDIEAKGIRNSFSPGDNLTIAVRKFKRENADDGDIEVGLSERTFSIYRVESIAPTETTNTRSYVLHFASPSYVVLNQIASDHVFSEYMGKISNSQLSDNFTSSYLIGGGSEGGVNEGVGQEEEDKKKEERICEGASVAEKRGLVNLLVEDYLSLADGVEGTPVPFEIENSKNSIWYRQFFPVVSANLDDYKAESLYTLLQDCADYAQNNNNPYAVNFHFWQDLDGIHFRSVESLLADQQYDGDEFPLDRIYTFAPDANQQKSSQKFNRVNELEVYNYVDLVELLTNGSLASIYRYWLNPRPDLVNTLTFNENEINFEMSREEINFLIDRSTYVYYYPRDYKLWTTIEASPLISNILGEYESKLLKPTLRNALKPQMITEPHDYQHGYNIVDNSPPTSFYNHYKHTRLGICELKDMLYIQTAVTRPMKAFYEMLNRFRQYDFNLGLWESGCANGAPFSFNFGYDPESPHLESLGEAGKGYTSKYLDFNEEKLRESGGNTEEVSRPTGETNEEGRPEYENVTVPIYDWYDKPTCSELAYIAASIPEECSLIENIMGEEWLGCGSRDHWYYGSLHRSVPTARFKQHTNAELSFFRDVCGSDDEFIDLLGVGSDSVTLDWKRIFPGLFSEGPDCTCPCQGSNSATKDKNFRKYFEYNRTFSRFWETDNWTPLLRNVQENLLKSQQLLITTSGNLFRKPGEIIALEVPITSTLADAESDPTQEFMRGRYMITAIKHNISANNTHTMEMELSRDSFPEPYASVGRDMLSNYDAIVDNNWFSGALSFSSDEVEYTRNIDTPGFLNAKQYKFFTDSPASGNDYTYNTGEWDKHGKPETTTVNFVDDNQTTIATRFADNPSIGLHFVTPFINMGAWKDFSDYDWSGYASKVGYLEGDFSKNKGEEETTEEEFLDTEEAG